MSRPAPNGGAGAGRAGGRVPQASSPAPDRGNGQRGLTLLRWYLCAVAVLAPLKFGSVIGPSEISLFPASVLEWVFGAWPPFLLGVLGGIGLGWALRVCPASLLRQPTRPVLGVWAALLIACSPGLLRTTEWDYAITFVLYLAGVCAFLAAALLMAAADSRFRRGLLAAVAVGTMASGLLGWYQRLWGFDEMRRFAETQARESGREWSSAMQGKFLQTRVHRPFFHPNSYAAHLVLTGPLVLVALWRAGRRVEPPRVAQPAFAAAGLVVVFGALVLSRSRAAQLALGAGLGLAVLSCRPLRRWRWPLLASALVAGLALMLMVNSGRDLLSASARLHYYKAAAAMFVQRPLTGVGLGEYLSAYVRIKPAGAEETRAAHNLILEMLSQTGLAGGLAATACALLPLWLAFRQRSPATGDDEALRLAAVCGLGAWVVHALMDFNLQIPPTVTLAAVLPVLCPFPTASVLSRSHVGERVFLAALAVAAGAAVWRVPGELRFRRLSDASGRLAPQEAFAAAQHAADGLPWSPEPWVIYGKEALATGRPRDAREAFARAVQRAPQRSSLHAWLAQAALLSGDGVAAAAAAQEAWELYPTSDRAVVLNALVRVLQSGDLTTAAETTAWLRAGLSCRAEVTEEGGGLNVWLSPGVATEIAAIPLAEVCQRFTALGLRTPGARSRPVRFRPADEPR